MTYNEKTYGYIKKWRDTHKEEFNALQNTYNKKRDPATINSYNKRLNYMKIEKKNYFDYEVEKKRFFKILL